jgi:hypothetical protein
LAAYEGLIDGRRLVWLLRKPISAARLAIEDMAMKTAFALKRAMARGLVLALACGVLATLAGCAGTSGDYWRERPAGNYQRLPVR